MEGAYCICPVWCGREKAISSCSVSEKRGSKTRSIEREGEQKQVAENNGRGMTEMGTQAGRGTSRQRDKQAEKEKSVPC